MGLLDSLLGNPQQKQDYQDYVSRYQQGAPSEGYTDHEVLQRYQQVAPQLPPQEYQQAAEQAFNRMSPEQRTEFGQYVQQQAQAQNMPAPGFGHGVAPGSYADSGYLAQQTAQLHQQQPGLLTQLLGGGGAGGAASSGGMLGSPVAKAALAGIAAMAISNAMGGSGGSPLGNIVGGVLGGQGNIRL